MACTCVAVSGEHEGIFSLKPYRPAIAEHVTLALQDRRSVRAHRASGITMQDCDMYLSVLRLK